MHIKKDLRQGQACFPLSLILITLLVEIHSLNWLALKDFHNPYPNSPRGCALHINIIHVDSWFIVYNTL